MIIGRRGFIAGLALLTLTACTDIEPQKGQQFIESAGFRFLGWSNLGGGCGTAIVQSPSGVMGTATVCGYEAFRWRPVK